MLRRGFWLIIIFPLVFTGCSKYQKLLKSADSKQKYEKAIEYFKKEDYYRALQLFDLVMPLYRATENAEDLYYYYAYCYYYQGDNILASYYFKRFSKDYPNSTRAEECAFMTAYCTYLDSPQYSLDQTSTQDAIKELQLFVNAYSYSPRVDTCNALIDELRYKLEEKAFEIAKLYYKMEDYKASITAFNNILRDFPDTRYKEEIMFDITNANYLYALKSIEAKKKERHLAASKASEIFMYSYPDSKYLKEIKSIYKQSKKALSIK